MTATITPYRSRQQAARDGFAQVLRSEWTKFRTVRGWVIAMCAAALVTALAPIELGVVAHNNNTSPNAATGPGGVAVTDDFYFVHQPLAGNGSITVRVSSLHGTLPRSQLTRNPPGYAPFPSTQPWAKAGIIVKASDKPGSAYAAMMVTGGHGVRMQYDFTQDIAGPAGAVSAAAPRWLRLTRSGDTLTGYTSTDGTHWTEVGTAHLAGLPSTVQAGLFAASPDYSEANQTFGGNNNGIDVPSQIKAAFGDVRLAGSWPARSWTGGQIGGGEGQPPGSGQPNGSGSVHAKAGGLPPDHFRQAAGTFTVVGSGDIAPIEMVTDPLLVAFYGTLIALIVVIALGAMFITAEFRRGLIRTTLAASPRRARVLAAKALVTGSVTFVAALIGAAVAFPVTQHMLNRGGWTAPDYPVIALFSTTGLRIVLGTAGLLAVAAVLALAAGAILRRGAGAVTAVVALVVFPLILAVVLPLGPANWLMRLSPAAAFSVQQSIPQYSQVSHSCLPYNGCYPLAPWAGFAVLCGWALAALAGAMILLRRRDV
jgi:ABC-type transport system involved in multi-copper enzyme maturation permease subunit